MAKSPREETALKIFREAKIVCFDVDSTVSPDEGIDVLAAFAGVLGEVAALTASAMGGKVLFQDALRRRLEIIRPTKAMFEGCLRMHPPRLTAGVDTLIAALHERGKLVYLVSGGLMPLVQPLAEMLNIPRERIIANIIAYNDDGSFLGFDSRVFTSRSGGKAEAIAHIRASTGLSPVVMIGDGATDLEARRADAAEIMIGFGGITVRDIVRRDADLYVTTFEGLTAALSAS